jgi:hypothetical protein
LIPTLATASLLLVSACSAQQDAATALVESSDPALARQASRLLPELADRSSLDLAAPVRVERRSRDELEAFLMEKLDEELPPDEAESLRDAYALLGLVPPDLDLRTLLLSVYGEQVAGFYDPAAATLFVMDDQPEATTETVLVHELVHAVQDQATDLDSITAKERGNDRQLAAQSAIEGHATLVMFEYLMGAQGLPLDLAAVPDFSSTIRPALEMMRTQFPALASAPAIVQESLLFPYLEGAAFVQAVWQSAPDRPAPFGDRLPESTEQILEPTRLLSEPPDRPTEVGLEPTGDGAVVYQNTLGALETGILLEAHGGPAARAARSGWDGDRYALFEAGGERSLVWVSVWDDEAARDRFVATLSRGLGGLGGPATLEPLGVMDRAAAVLTVGPAPEVRVRLTGGVP